MPGPEPTLLVLAAGMGRRYGGLKQIDPVGPAGEIVVDYSIYDALRAGFGKVVFVIRRDLDDLFREAVGRKFEGRLPVHYAYQELEDVPAGYPLPSARAKPWGTAHAVLAAEALIEEPFAVINADDFYGPAGYASLYRHFSSADASYALVAFELRKTLSAHGAVSRGICQCDQAGWLQSVMEMTHIERDGEGAVHTDEQGRQAPLTGDELTSMNMWGFTPAVFAQLRGVFERFLAERGQDPGAECYLPTAIDSLVANGKASVRVLPSHDAWFGVTYPEDKASVVADVERLVGDGVYPAPLWG